MVPLHGILSLHGRQSFVPVFGSRSHRPSSSSKKTDARDSLYANFLAATKIMSTSASSPSLLSRTSKRPSDASLPLKKRMKLGGGSSFHTLSCGSSHALSKSSSCSSSIVSNEMNETWTIITPSLFQPPPHNHQQQMRHRSDTSLSTLTRASGYIDSPTLNSEWTTDNITTANNAAKKTCSETNSRGYI